jgi:hypothetical protein
MSAISIIERVVQSGVLIEELVVIPKLGATDEMILNEEKKLPRRFSEIHKDILKRWNGMNIDVVRLHGCEPVESGIFSISDRQLDVLANVQGGVVFADDAAGFSYAEAEDGRIFSIDNDGGSTKEVSVNMDRFFTYWIFGLGAKEFAGEDWQKELVDAGVL